MVDDGVVIYAAAVAVGGPAVYFCLSAVLFCLSVGRFWSLLNRDRAAASAGPSSRGCWYYIGDGFRTIAASANLNSTSAKPSPGPSDDANRRPDRSYSFIGIHSGREKRRRPCQGGDLIYPIVNIIGETSLSTIGLPTVGPPWSITNLSSFAS